MVRVPFSRRLRGEKVAEGRMRGAKQVHAELTPARGPRNEHLDSQAPAGPREARHGAATVIDFR